MGANAQLLRFKLGEARYAVLSFEAPPKADAADLTPAERDVAACILDGLSNKQIAKKRRTSARTVANQVASLFRKLSVSSRAELAARMHEAK